MNQKAALIKALLAGEVVSIMTGFKLMGITNVPREIGRSIEREFDVTVSRVIKKSKTRYGGDCCYTEYRLNRSEHNLPGIQKMLEYLKEHSPTTAPRTDAEEKEQRKTQQIAALHQPQLFQ